MKPYVKLRSPKEFANTLAKIPIAAIIPPAIVAIRNPNRLAIMLAKGPNRSGAALNTEPTHAVELLFAWK